MRPQPTPAPAPLHQPAAARPPRRPWGFVFGALLLAVSFAVAWSVLNTPSRAQSPGNGNGHGSPGRGGRNAVAIAYVDHPEGVSNLYPTRQGLVKSLPVAEGVEVAKGTVLLEVDDTIAKLQKKEVELAVKAAEEDLTQAKDAVAQHRLKVQAQALVVKAAQSKVRQARIQAAKAKRVAKEFDKDLSKPGTKDTLALADLAVEEAEAAAGARQKELELARAMSPAGLIRKAELNLQAKRDQLAKATEDVEAHKLKAPARGKVLRRLAKVGEALGPSPKLPALIFCPSGERIVRAEVEQEFAGLITVGQKARIEDDATGGGKWGGKVQSVSDWYTHRRSILMEPLQFNDVRTLEVIITLEEGKAPLRIGQRVRVMLEGAN
jgi:multidrug resistance efflux pump